MRIARRVTLGATTALMFVSGILAVPTPAEAMDSSVAIRADYWVNVSSNGTRTVNDNTVDALVGLQQKATKSIVSRAYYHFDVSELAGKNILSARLTHEQIHSPNPECGLESFGPGVQVGVTDPVNYATAWPGPAWRTTLDVDTNAHGDETLCPYPQRVGWEVETGVEQAAAGRVADLTLGFRSAGESDPEGFRKFASGTGYPVLVVKYNSTPDTPSEVGTYDPAVPCSPSADDPELISSATPQLSARLTDDDSGSQLHGQFELYEGDALVWSVRTSYTVYPPDTVRMPVPAQKLTHDHSYWFRVRAEEETEEGLLVSGWSQSCHFRVDISYPAPPAVVSEDYPECRDSCPVSGGIGVPGEFTFSTGADDVVTYVYSFNGGDYLTAQPSVPGGPVTQWITPDSAGINLLYVFAVDAAGNSSAGTYYRFNVAP